jgi:hypothetical protein
MAGVADVALPIARFVAVEVVERRFTARWQRPVVAVMRVEAVVYMPVKAVVAVEPWT